jgi:hypothetical protein
MSAALASLTTLAFAFAIWLGSYLIARDPRDDKLLLAGLGLIAYGLALGLDALTQLAPQPLLLRAQWFASFLPALLWSGVLLHLLRDEGKRARLTHRWKRVWLPIGSALLVAGALLFDPAAGALRPAAALPLLAAVLLPLLLAAIELARDLRTSPRRDLTNGALLIALLFTLGAGLLLFPLAPLPRALLLFAVAADLEALGLLVAAFDALDLGQVFVRDALRSLLASFLTALLLGGQVAMVMVLATGLSAAMLALLLLTVGSSLALVAFAPRLQGALDGLAFPRDPALRRERALLRDVAEAAPRRATAPTVEPRGEPRGEHPLLADQTAFVHHARHALRHHNDLGRLASNPLTDLPAVREHLGNDAGTLERAQTLKLLLEESVAKLKPPGPEPFGTTDAWRHYNVLHFPYLVGIKPFSQRPHHADLDATAEQALEWFRTHVPERTFYNWQRAATELVAQDLRERSRGN